MKVFSNLKMYRRESIFLLWFLVSAATASGQSVHIAAGTLMSQYDYLSKDGAKSDYFKKGSGTYFRMGAEFKLLDTLKYLTTTSTKGFYFSSHKGLANILTRMNLEAAVDNSQLNAVGDVRGVAFNYQTNYIGLSAGLGYQQPIFKGWSLKATGKAQGLKIVQGNQELLGSYRDLTQDSDFNKIQLALGWEVSLSKQVNPGLSSFISFSKSSTLNAEKAGTSTLNFHNTLFSIGLKFNTLTSPSF